MDMEGTKNEVDVDLSKQEYSKSSNDEVEEISVSTSINKHELLDKESHKNTSNEGASNQEFTSKTKKRRKQTNPVRFSGKRKYNKHDSLDDDGCTEVLGTSNSNSTQAITPRCTSPTLNFTLSSTTPSPLIPNLVMPSPSKPGIDFYFTPISNKDNNKDNNNNNKENNNNNNKDNKENNNNNNNNNTHALSLYTSPTSNTSNQMTTNGSISTPTNIVVSPSVISTSNLMTSSILPNISPLPVASSTLISNLTVLNNHGNTPLKETALYQNRIKALEEQLEEEKHKNIQFEDKIETLNYTIETYGNDLKTLTNEIQTKQNEIENSKTKFSSEIIAWIQLYAQADAKERRHQSALDSSTIGKIIMERVGHQFLETWQDGSIYQQIKQKEIDLLKRRDKIEQEKKYLKKMQTKPNKIDKDSDSLSNVSSSTTSSYDNEFDILVKGEALKMNMIFLKKDQLELQEQTEKYQIDKALHIRELKRLRDEDSSRFKICSILNDRYLLIQLLGKGGFSEVWHAYDLSSFIDVAVKIHQLSSSWADERKSNYIKHAIREHDIQKRLRHEHVVALYDCFVIDDNGFATVLEYCPGPDLERYLKQYNTLKEVEARSIIIQLLSALKYMNSQPTRIIHYDLKPANILFDSQGNAKISDFGLSKEMTEDVSSQGMELTSQGAGTYWYLPPECFKTDASMPPLINTKVDVWSIGVILYQMLFGKKPFGDGISQEKIVENKIILNANPVEIPSKPQITAECRDFIYQCLHKDIKLRADVMDLCKHPFIMQYKDKK